MPPESPVDGPSLEVGGGRSLRVVIAVGGVLLALAIVAGAVFLLVGRDGDDEGADKVGEDTSSTPPDAPASGATLELPTIDASDFPSDLPTTVPTVAPSRQPSLPAPPADKPTKVPSGFPSGMPSQIPDFPTDPADMESWFSEYLEQMGP
ncbi:hypothetical protein KVF89_19385 [Nocardioides carbamazepini]|uniref:hypothetical protein n=1 Tax=Nocardioides carbamazepini TaxID=2854259 RepID=UPI00214A8162|nr:hypothetical protein [Nocardioides carbamazepini]MCR1784715.1 hypothetical protein [Nocardioides carbamazepini]